jgi:hypothetical protein
MPGSGVVLITLILDVVKSAAKEVTESNEAANKFIFKNLRI